MTILFYLLKSMLCAGILLAYYWIFLRNKRFHRYNRFYLLATVCLALVLPLLQVSFTLGGASQPVLLDAFRSISAANWEAQQTQLPSVLSAGAASRIPEILLYSIYAAIAAVFLFSLLLNLRHIAALKKQYPSRKFGQLTVYDTLEPGSPFSFFRSIFWNKTISFSDHRGRQIFQHELFHVKQKHSADNLLLAVVCALCWINPFFHLVRKELRAIHEFLADQYAISGSNQLDYAELLLSESLRRKQLMLVNPFFNTQLKRRIAMITNFTQQRCGYGGRMMALPLLALLFCFVVLRANRLSALPPDHPAVVSEKAGTVQETLTRHFSETLQFPVACRNLTGTYTQYFSIELDESGKTTDFIAYSQVPASPTLVSEIAIAENAGTGPSPEKDFDGLSRSEQFGFTETLQNAAYRLVLAKGAGTEATSKHYFKVRWVAGNDMQQQDDTIPKVFTKVEVNARYPGAPGAFYEYTRREVKQPVDANGQKIDGSVELRFIVSRKGELSNIEAINGPAALRKEAIRVMAASGKWIPALQNGKPVTAYHRMIIVFGPIPKVNLKNFKKPGTPPTE